MTPILEGFQTRPRLLDLFCGVGGAAMGYHRAGFEVVGVDLHPQPDYPFELHQADALTFPLEGFDAIHASPPCQAYTAGNRAARARGAARHPDLLAPMLARLEAHGAPYACENVPGAPYPPGLYRVMLCGSAFALSVRRHRWFVTNAPMLAPSCQHDREVVGVYGASDGAHPPGFKHPGRRRGPRQVTTVEAREVMDMPWARRRVGLTNAIPPAYTEFIGAALLAAVVGRPVTHGEVGTDRPAGRLP